ncbi:MAG: amidohydrolase family protein [Pseudomonadota bacterium]
MDTFAIDSHAHIFERALHMAHDKRYTPDRDARLPDYLAQLDHNGFSHGVLVQPSFLGTDNGYLLAALQACPDRLCGVVVVDPAMEQAPLAALAAQGVVGVRLNLFERPLPDFRQAPWRGFQRHLQQLGLHVEVHCLASHLHAILPSFLHAGNQVVVDHFGRPEGPLGMDDAGFRFLLAAGASGQVWVKLSSAYRLGSAGGLPFAGPQVTARLVEALGLDRLVWGSDWPHTQFTDRMDFPSARRLLDTLLPDPQARRRILGASAQALFRF